MKINLRTDDKLQALEIAPQREQDGDIDAC